MTNKKIVACLDIKDGKVVKGVRFIDIKQVGDPIERAKLYAQGGADELCFYDISASVEGRILFTDLLARMVKAVDLPVSAAGGVHTADDFARVMDTGVVKVSMNAGALQNPSLVEECARRFGKERVVVAVDVDLVNGSYHCFNQAGANDTGIETLGWLKRAEEMGAGEIVVNAIHTDGVRGGYNIPLLKQVCDTVSIPVVASGGAGSIEDIVTLFRQVPKCAAALGASIFHFGLVDGWALKKRLLEEGVPVDMRGRA